MEEKNEAQEKKSNNASVNPSKEGIEYVPGKREKGNSDKITRDYLDSMLLVYRHVGAVPPDSGASILGHSFTTPIMSSALAVLEKIRPGGGSIEFAKGMQRAGALMWTGWIAPDDFQAVCETGVKAVCGIKPFADNDRIFDAIERAAASGAVACCMDIDHCFDDTGKDCWFMLGDLAHKTEDEIAQYAAAAKAAGMPFILKGILSPEEAVRAKELGVGGVFVSHHKGIWCYAAPPAMMLPEIRTAVGEDYPVFADCDVHDGVDAFKLLAMGANGVGVGRELMKAFAINGADGVYDRLMFMNDELKGTMAKTHCASIGEINASSIRMRIGW